MSIDNNRNLTREEINSYISKIMVELGFKIGISGANLFKDGILYLLETDEEILWTKNVYPKLGKKYNLSGAQVERNLRYFIECGIKNYLDNETSRYIYGKNYHLTVSECLTKVVEYIKLKNTNEILKELQEQKNKQTYSYKYSENNSISSTNEINMSLEQRVSYTISCLGIPTNIKGYYYLNYAILHMLRNKESISYANIYNEIANIYSDSYIKVERAIRAAISKWTAKYKNMSQEELKNTKTSDITKFVYNYGIKFNNFEFISLVTEYIKIYSKEYQNEIIKADQNTKIRKK